jgi:hypothetical protein
MIRLDNKLKIQPLKQNLIFLPVKNLKENKMKKTRELI